MEAKLLYYARKLPVSKNDFDKVEKLAAKRKSGRKAPPRLRLAIVVMLVICLATTAFAYSAQKYGLWSGMSSTAFADVKLLNWKHDYRFPETLGGSPFERITTTYGAPEGASHIQALLQPTYRLYTITYGAEDGNTIAVGFGTTQQETWKYHFSVAEDGSCNYDGVIPGSQSTIEYEGYVLHRYRTGSTDNIRWEDPERQLVIDITVWDQELDIVEIAKELIDQNLQRRPD